MEYFLWALAWVVGVVILGAALFGAVGAWVENYSLPIKIGVSIAAMLVIAGLGAIMAKALDSTEDKCPAGYVTVSEQRGKVWISDCLPREEVYP
jgi:hypothetical protein